MKTIAKECLCHVCNGVGEVPDHVDTEFGYYPVYEECYVCNGEGYLEIYPDAVYNPDVM